MQALDCFSLFRHLQGIHNSAGGPETFVGLRNATINRNNMNDGAKFFFGDAVFNGAFAVKIPFMHLHRAPIIVRFIMERVLGLIIKSGIVRVSHADLLILPFGVAFFDKGTDPFFRITGKHIFNHDIRGIIIGL